MDEVGSIQLAGRVGQTTREIAVADDVDTVMSGDFVGDGAFAIPALFGSQINHDAAWSHRLNHRTGDQLGGGFAGNQSRRNDDVDFFCLSRK